MKIVNNVLMEVSNADIIDGTFEIPYGVVEIGVNAFRKKQLKNITIPSTVTKIAPFAFISNQLRTINIPESVTVIGDGAFSENQLLELTLPSQLNSIGTSAFSYNLITSVDIPESVTHIGNNAFMNNKLFHISLPDTLTTISNNVFANNQLTEIKLPKSLKTIGVAAFQNNRLASVELPESLNIIDNYAFMGNELEELYIPDQVSFVGNNSLFDNQIQKLRIPAKINDIFFIGSRSCNKLKTLTIGDRIIDNLNGAYDANKVGSKLILLANAGTEYRIINGDWTEEIITKKEIVDNFDLNEEKTFEYIIENMRPDKILDWQKMFTSKTGNIDKDTLSKMAEEIIYYLPANRENANLIKQGLKSYNRLRKRLNWDFDENSSLFKLCFAIGFFSGEHFYSKYVQDYISNAVNDSFLNKTIVDILFNDLNLENGYNKQVSMLMINALKDQYFVVNKCIDRIYNDYGDIKQFTQKSYKFDMRLIEAKIEQARLDGNKRELTNLTKQLEEHEKAIRNPGIEEVKYYIENNSFSIRPGNEELKMITPSLRGTIKQKEFDELQDLYERSRGLEKDIIQTVDLHNGDFIYQWSASDNPYNLALGQILDCCARKNGSGEDIMVQSILNPSIQNLLIRDKNLNVIAKATAYYNKEEKYILFNTVEASNAVIGQMTRGQKEKAKEAIKRAVRDQVWALQNKGILINDVRIGMLRNDLFKEEDLFVIHDQLLPNYKYRNYEGDANSTEYGQGVLFSRKLNLEKMEEDEPIKVR